MGKSPAAEFFYLAAGARCAANAPERLRHSNTHRHLVRIALKYLATWVNIHGKDGPYGRKTVMGYVPIWEEYPSMKAFIRSRRKK